MYEQVTVSFVSPEKPYVAGGVDDLGEVVEGKGTERDRSSIYVLKHPRFSFQRGALELAIITKETASDLLKDRAVMAATKVADAIDDNLEAYRELVVAGDVHNELVFQPEVGERKVRLYDPWVLERPVDGDEPLHVESPVHLLTKFTNGLGDLPKDVEVPDRYASFPVLARPCTSTMEQARCPHDVAARQTYVTGGDPGIAMRHLMGVLEARERILNAYEIVLPA